VRLPRPDLLVAPPLTRARLRERGFNQALELAKTVGRELGVAVAIEGLRKVRETAPQPSLGGKARRRNLRGAFACRTSLAGAHVAIVDDVLTTGATADAVARVLKGAGAARVSLWTVARASGARR
jgi:ComF family protein